MSGPIRNFSSFRRKGDIFNFFDTRPHPVHLWTLGCFFALLLMSEVLAQPGIGNQGGVVLIDDFEGVQPSLRIRGGNGLAGLRKHARRINHLFVDAGVNKSQLWEFEGAKRFLLSVTWFPWRPSKNFRSA